MIKISKGKTYSDLNYFCLLARIFCSVFITQLSFIWLEVWYHNPLLTVFYYSFFAIHQALESAPAPFNHTSRVLPNKLPWKARSNKITFFFGSCHSGNFYYFLYFYIYLIEGMAKDTLKPINSHIEKIEKSTTCLLINPLLAHVEVIMGRVLFWNYKITNVHRNETSYIMLSIWRGHTNTHKQFSLQAHSECRTRKLSFVLQLTPCYYAPNWR